MCILLMMHSMQESPQTSPQAKQESRAQHEELFPPPNSFWDDDKSRPPLPLQRFRRHGIDHTPVQPERESRSNFIALWGQQYPGES